MASFIQIKLSTEQDSAYGMSKSGAQGTHKLTVKAPAYTGRENRVDKVVATSDDNPEVKATATITQQGSNILKFATGSGNTQNESIGADGGEIEVAIISNAESLTPMFSTPITGITVTEDEESLTSNNPYAPAGDPGASEQYTRTLKIAVAANTLAEQRDASVTISDGTTTLTIEISQAAASATIELTPLTATIPAAGGTVELTLTTNDDWDAAVTD